MRFPKKIQYKMIQTEQLMMNQITLNKQRNVQSYRRDGRVKDFTLTQGMFDSECETDKFWLLYQL